MKNIILLSFLIISISVNSQISYEFSIPGNYYLDKYSTTSLGDKLVTQYQNGDSLGIYNSDGSLYRLVVLPTGYKTEGDFISDKLYNSDSLIEFIGYKSGGSTYSIINDLGQIVYTFPDTTIINGVYVFSLNGQFKISYQTTNKISKIYSLPGSLPCNQCNYTTGLVEPNTGGSLSGLNVFPNPFSGNLSIEYNTSEINSKVILSDITGRELRTIQLTNQSDKLILNTSDLSKGVIIVSLVGSNQNVISKKVIKIQ